MWTRTTGALESYNGTLGKRIKSKGHFFKFVLVLLDEEFENCRNFHSLLRGRDDKIDRGNKYQVIFYYFYRLWKFNQFIKIIQSLFLRHLTY